ncbi:thioesterase II family protein [Pseudoramibacter alactolyticus]
MAETSLTPWFAHGAPRESAAVNIVCFPFAGGTASQFSEWKGLFPEAYGIYPVLYPLRERRMAEMMPESVEALAASLVEENAQVFEKPAVLFGQCTGGLIAYEAARCLKAQGKTPRLFVASGSTPPDNQAIGADVAAMSDADLLTFLLESGRIDEAAVKMPAFMDYYFPILKADMRLLGKYRYPADFKIDCPLLCVQADEDSLAPAEDLAEWQAYILGPRETLTVHGDHYFLAENARVIAQKMRAMLER